MLIHATPEKSNSSSFINRKKQQPFFSPVIIQAKLTIGPVDDPYEREADAMADKVMRMSDGETLQTKPSPINIQRKCAHCEEEEEEKLQRKEDNEDNQLLYRKPIADLPVQRKCAACEEEKNIQPKRSTGGSVPAVTPFVNHVLQSSGHPLEMGTRSFMESRFGYDFSNVQIHNDSLAHQSSADINALAYTHDRHIVFGAGQYQPNTNSGKQLLAHELTHVMQQKEYSQKAGLIMRQPLPPGRSTTIDSNGKKYIITRDYKLLTAEKEKTLPPSARFGADAKNVFINITWCKGEKGSLKIGANIPQQATDLLKRIATDVANGGGSQEIRNELEKTDLTPFINLEVAKSGSWKFSVQTNVTVDSSGVKQVGGSVVIDTGSIKITGSVSGSKDQGVTGSVGVEVPLGKGPEKFECKTEKIKAKYKPTDTCESITPEHIKPGTKKETTVDDQSVYIYFEYARPDIEPKKTKAEIEKLKGLIGGNYSIKKVIGYTSPEGLTAPVKGFMGNEELSKQRTKAAFDKATGTCDDVSKIHPEISCSGITSETEQIPGNELYTLTRDTNGKTEEVEGNELVESAEEQFLESPEEKRFTDDPDFRKKLQRAKTSKQKADLIYPLLRRAKIILEKSSIVEKPDNKIVPEDRQSVDCDSIPGYDQVRLNWDVNDNLGF